jgi:methionyl-tRNA formyltransferase
MDAELDTGAILAQTTVPILDTDTTIWDLGPRLVDASLALLEGVLAKLVAGDPGEPQDDSLATWAGRFEADYAEIDWSRPARAVHDQVRAWNLSLGINDVLGAVGDVHGERLHVLRTSLADPGGGERRVECGDGPIWILESEPLD